MKIFASGIRVMVSCLLYEILNLYEFIIISSKILN